LDIVTEVQDTNGDWTSIVYLPRSWCGNSYHTITLGPDEYWEFAMPIFKGDFKTKLRYKLKNKLWTYVSNEIDVFINKDQLDKEKKQGYKTKNLMDPYVD